MTFQKKNVFLLLVCVSTAVVWLIHQFTQPKDSHEEVAYMANYSMKAQWTYTELGANLKAFLDGSELEEGVEPGVAYEELTNTSILPFSARIVAKKIFHTKPLVIWATEWHMTPIKDIATILSPFGVVVKDYNLDPWRCQWHDCNAKKKLKVLKSDNVLDLKGSLADTFVSTYQQNSEMAAVDVVYCSYPASLCQIYLRLNKSVLVHASTRYDVGRYTPQRLTQLNEDYKKLAKTPWNVISGNNLYDAQFITYYTGVKTYHLPSVCDYTGASYNSIHPTYAIFRRRDHGFNKLFKDAFNKFCKRIDCRVKTQNLPHSEYKDIAAYRGVVHIPYQVSVMSIFEQYRMNMPMFVPSPQLLASWQSKHFLMPERSFDGAFFNKRLKASLVPAHSSMQLLPDPKNEFHYDSILHWIKSADFYQALPYSVVYESIPHLVHILNTITNHELRQISAKMQAYNIDFKKKLLKKWRAILLRYAANSPNHPH